MKAKQIVHSDPTGSSATLSLQLSTSRSASCDIWWTPEITLADSKPGLIGRFTATDDTAATGLLHDACSVLAQHGCDRAIGPMDGDTWHNYRLVTDRGDNTPFLMEPWNPPEWPEYFISASFTPLANYYSAVTSNLENRDPRLDTVRRRLSAAGVTIRAIDRGRFEEELKKIFATCLAAFEHNFLYTPISCSEFLRLYLPAEPLVHPKLVLVAEQEGKNVGFVFALPDTTAPETAPRIIVKTLAISPSRKLAGLGAVLLEEAHHNAAQLRFTAAIHALMHESNKSLSLSARNATITRRYTLFERPIARS